MSNLKFRTYEEMLLEAEQLLREDYDDAYDRRVLSDFYNGKETMSRSEAENEGVRNVINHMLGFDTMNLAKIQVEGIYTKGSILWHINLMNMKQELLHMKSDWELKIQQKLNEIVRKSRRFKPEWKSLAGELPLFGAACLTFKDQYDWCPQLTRVYVPRMTGILANEVSHSMMLDHMTLFELRKARSCSRRRRELGYKSHWREAELTKVIEMLEGNIGSTPSNFVNSANEPEDEAQEKMDMDHGTGSTTRACIPVYRMYIARTDTETGEQPYDLVIMPRLTATQRDVFTKRQVSLPSVLFHCPAYFDRADEFLHPFFVDCKLGGRTSWHRVMGLGRLNYDSDVETEEFFSEAMAGAREKMRRVYQVNTASDWELLKTWASGEGPANVLPPGVTVADLGREPNFQYAMTPFNLLMQLTRRNGASQMSNPGSGSHAEELEVNALERQNRSAEALAARMGDIYECGDALGHEIFRRFLSEYVLPGEPGYAEIAEFQTFLKEKGIPISYLRKMKGGKLQNVSIKSSRAAGDGSAVQQKMANGMMLSRLELFPEEAQKIILRRIVASETSDHDFAETVVPYKPRRDSNQVNIATQENDTMDRQGILGYVPPVNDDDLDQTHIEEHMRSMEADVERGKVRPWDKIDVEGFKSKGAHTYSHIERFKGVKANGEQANQMVQKLQELAKAGQEYANNIQEQEEASKKPLTQKEEIDAMQKEKEIEHKKRVQDDLVDFREKSLAQKTGKALIDTSLRAREIAGNQQNMEHQQTMSETGVLQKKLADEQSSIESDQRTAAAKDAMPPPENAEPTLIQ